jgi:hypothetical protein
VPRANARPKITHCTLVNPDLIRRIKAIGAVPALFTTYAFYNPDKFVYYGEEMMKNCMAFRSLVDAGVYAAAGSDFSPGPFAPLMGIQGMVTRKGWDGKVWGANQRLSVSEAIAVNTYNGAWASGEEALKGSIAAGKLADYVVLADDPHTVNAEKIRTSRSSARWWAARSRTRHSSWWVTGPIRPSTRSPSASRTSPCSPPRSSCARISRPIGKTSSLPAAPSSSTGSSTSSSTESRRISRRCRRWSTAAGRGGWRWRWRRGPDRSWRSIGRRRCLASRHVKPNGAARDTSSFRRPPSCSRPSVGST